MFYTLVLLALSVHTVSCPAMINAAETLQSPIAGWDVSYGNGQKRLVSAAVYAGKPSRRASVQPLPGKSRTWLWPDLPDNAWLECSYEATSVKLSRPLGVSYKCVFSETRAGSIEPPTMNCLRRTAEK